MLVHQRVYQCQIDFGGTKSWPYQHVSTVWLCWIHVLQHPDYDCGKKTQCHRIKQTHYEIRVVSLRQGWLQHTQTACYCDSIELLHAIYIASEA